jgi:RimJ/RimL family protein N-acetyltransferase
MTYKKLKKGKIETESLVLKNIGSSRYEELYNYRSLPEVARYQLWEPYSIDTAKTFVKKYDSDKTAIPGEWTMFGLFLKKSDILIGDTAFKAEKDEPRNFEYGIVISPQYQHKGYATEALKALFDFIFTKLDAHRITGLTDAENSASYKLMERLGMRREAHFIRNVWFKGGWGSEYIYAILKEEWEKNLCKIIQMEK